MFREAGFLHQIPLHFKNAGDAIAAMQMAGVFAPATSL
jgi:hypothetical protein